MAVGEEKSLQVRAVGGVRVAAVEAGIRYPNRLDLVLIELTAGSVTVGVFTQNAFCAAPVVVSRQHLQQAASRYLLINTGNANAGTGTAGIEAAQDCCRELAEQTGCETAQVLPFSTGVIGEPLPTQKLTAALPRLIAGLSSDAWESAARGIMTTDTRPKAVSRRLMIDGRQVTITGIAKGAGMIKPNMATMLAFVVTDAAIAQDDLQLLLNSSVNRSFNRLSVDGDTSTNDCCMLSATGTSGASLASRDQNTFEQFRKALNGLFVELATELIRDAEGASKFVTIQVEGGADSGECLQVAYCVAESPLVKTALFAADPNWGRILAAIGRAGLQDLEIDKVSIRLGQTLLVSSGQPDPDYSEAAGQAEMDLDEITIRIDLGRGHASETVWTSDLSHEYIRINAEYRT